MLKKISKKSIFQSLNAYGVIVGFCTVFSFWALDIFLADLLDSFRFQYFWALIVIAPLNFFQKNYKTGIIFLILAFVNLVHIAPYWKADRLNENSQYSIFMANVLSTNTEYEKLKTSLKKHKPDIIALIEVTNDLARNLEFLNSDYSFSVIVPREDNFGIALYSRFPLVTKDVFISEAKLESIRVDLNLGGELKTIVVTHPLPPAIPSYWSLRNAQFKQLVSYLGSISNSKILVGDFNAVPWCPHLQALKNSSELKLYGGIQDTWPTALPWGFRIRLDHILSSPEVKGEANILDSIGSDHLPILFKF